MDDVNVLNYAHEAKRLLHLPECPCDPGVSAGRKLFPRGARAIHIDNRSAGPVFILWNSTAFATAGNSTCTIEAGRQKILSAAVHGHNDSIAVALKQMFREQFDGVLWSGGLCAPVAVTLSWWQWIGSADQVTITEIRCALQDNDYTRSPYEREAQLMGAKLRELRESRYPGPTGQQDLALAVGVHLDRIREYEAGRTTIPEIRLRKLAEHFAVSAEEFRTAL